MRRHVASLVAVALAALPPVVGSSAHAADSPAPTLKIVTARLHYPGPKDKRLQVALTGSCSSTQSDTLGLIVTTDRPSAITNDLIECTNKTSTELVLLSADNGTYLPNKPVTITASLRTADNKVLATDTRTVNVEENFDYTVGEEPPAGH